MVGRTGLFAIAASLLVISEMAGPANAASVSEEAPDFALKSIAGPNLRLSEYRSEVVVLAFWASWCGECRTQLQDFREVYESYRNAGFELLSVSLDPEIDRASGTAEDLGLNFPVLHDPDGRVSRLYEVEDLPLLVFIDREGTVRESTEGFSRSQHDSNLSTIRTLLRE